MDGINQERARRKSGAGGEKRKSWRRTDDCLDRQNESGKTRDSLLRRTPGYKNVNSCNDSGCVTEEAFSGDDVEEKKKLDRSRTSFLKS